jgi:hypothetical protein
MVEGILYGDTLLYDGKDTSGIPKLKKEYVGVIIHGRNHVSLKASGDSVYTSLIPNCQVSQRCYLLSANC